MHKKIIIILASVAFVFQCMNSHKASISGPGYIYLDGSANKYIITQTFVEYEPVQPENSSTGMYSGGKPWQIKIGPGQFACLHSVFQKAITTKNGQTEHRGKGTGMLIVQPDNVRYIFEMNSIQKKQIEAALAAIR